MLMIAYLAGVDLLTGEGVVVGPHGGDSVACLCESNVWLPRRVNRSDVAPEVVLTEMPALACVPPPRLVRLPHFEIHRHHHDSDCGTIATVRQSLNTHTSVRRLFGTALTEIEGLTTHCRPIKYRHHGRRRGHGKQLAGGRGRPCRNFRKGPSHRQTRHHHPDHRPQAGMSCTIERRKRNTRPNNNILTLPAGPRRRPILRHEEARYTPRRAALPSLPDQHRHPQASARRRPHRPTEGVGEARGGQQVGQQLRSQEHGEAGEAEAAE